MRYYFVLDPIEDFQVGSLGFSLNPRVITQIELMTLINQQTTIKLFSSYDSAKELAHGLRENAYDYTHWPKTDASNSKVRPLITVDIVENLNLGVPQKETFKYQEHYYENAYRKTRTKETELSYHVIPRDQIQNRWLVRAEFYNSRMKPLEFDHNPPSERCVIS